MARDHDRNPVATVGSADRAARPGAPHAGSKNAVGRRRPERDPPKLGPHGALELRAENVEGHLEADEVAGEVGAQLSDQLFEVAVPPGHDGKREVSSHFLQLRRQGLPVREFQEANAVLRGPGTESADRTRKGSRDDRFAEHAVKVLARESAGPARCCGDAVVLDSHVMSASEEIWVAIQESNRAWVGGNPKGVEALYADDVVFVAPKLAARVAGRDALVQSYVDYVNTAKTKKFDERDHVVDVSGDTAVATYIFAVRYEIEGRTFDDTGQEILVFARRSGRWRAIWRTQIVFESKEVRDVLLTLAGELPTPRAFSASELAALPGQVEDIGVEVPGRVGSGVRLRSVLEAAGARGAFLTLCSSDGFSICVPRAAVEDGVLVYRLGDGELPAKQGGPLRFFVGRAVACDTGEVDACANVKALSEIRVTATKQPDSHRH